MADFSRATKKVRRKQSKIFKIIREYIISKKELYPQKIYN